MFVVQFLCMTGGLYHSCWVWDVFEQNVERYRLKEARSSVSHAGMQESARVCKGVQRYHDRHFICFVLPL